MAAIALETHAGLNRSKTMLNTVLHKISQLCRYSERDQKMNHDEQTLKTSTKG